VRGVLKPINGNKPQLTNAGWGKRGGGLAGNHLLSTSRGEGHLLGGKNRISRTCLSCSQSAREIAKIKWEEGKTCGSKYLQGQN